MGKSILIRILKELRINYHTRDMEVMLDSKEYWKCLDKMYAWANTPIIKGYENIVKHIHDYREQQYVFWYTIQLTTVGMICHKDKDNLSLKLYYARLITSFYKDANFRWTQDIRSQHSKLFMKLYGAHPVSFS